MAKIDTIWRKISYLHSHHDKFFLHKAMTPFLFLLVMLMACKGIGGGSPVALHVPILLARHERMWKEFQLHSITFAMRSLGVMLLIYLGLHRFRAVVVITCHYVADQVTKRYKQGTTMRDMPLPDVLIPYSNEMNLFYSTSQLFAIVGVLVLGIEEVFLILFPIQFAAFLLTLVRKNIIGPLGWHALYTLSLLLPHITGAKGGRTPLYRNHSSNLAIQVADLIDKFVQGFLCRYFCISCRLGSKKMDEARVAGLPRFLWSSNACKASHNPRQTTRQVSSWNDVIDSKLLSSSLGLTSLSNRTDVGNKQKDPSVLSFIASMVKS
eukprot:524378-Hanusia_phi.AAC.17